MPNTTLRSAIVGVGQARGKGSPTTGSFRIGYVHAQMYGRTPGYELAAAADINPGNLAAFQEQFAVPGYGGIDEMLAAARPDVTGRAAYGSIVAEGRRAVIYYFETRNNIRSPAGVR